MKLREIMERNIVRKIARYSLVFFSLSIINYQLSIALAQKYPERRSVRQGTKLYHKGDYTGAETKYRGALEIAPEMREAAFNLGGALWKQEKVQEAADAWMGIAADSLSDGGMIAAASYNVGNAALAGQQIDAAIESYKQSLRLNPDDMEAKFNLAYAQKMKEQQQEQEQNQDQDQDQNDQNNDQNDQNGQNDDDKNQNDNQDGEGENEDQNGDGENDSPQGDGDEPPPPSGEGQGEGKIDPRAAEQMLDAMQAAEDDTREKMNAREVQAGARNGKNW